MKCTHKLCQRTKNLKQSGYCNVCDDLIEEMKAKQKATEKPKTFKPVELDFKLLRDTHDKLVNGKPVEPQVMNILLLSGITNVLCHSKVVDDAMEKVKILEVENITNKTRLDLLEDWVLKMSEENSEMRKKIDKDKGANPGHLEIKVDALAEEITLLKNNPKARNQNKKCTECEQSFSKNCELEKHMVEIHGNEKPFSCDMCGKKFFLNWRLKKHASVHEEHTKKCKYYKHGKICPYSDIGCMYKHEENEENADDMETLDDEEILDEEETSPSVGSFCCYCNTLFRTQQELIEHMGDAHMDQFTHLHGSQDLM